MNILWESDALRTTPIEGRHERAMLQLPAQCGKLQHVFVAADFVELPHVSNRDVFKFQSWKSFKTMQHDSMANSPVRQGTIGT